MFKHVKRKGRRLKTTPTEFLLRALLDLINKAITIRTFYSSVQNQIYALQKTADRIEKDSCRFSFTSL